MTKTKRMDGNLQGPWYNHQDYWVQRANRYIFSALQAFKENPYQKQIISFQMFNICRVIFESNLIEGAGLSEGQTKKAIFEHFPSIPNSLELFNNLQNRTNLLEKMLSDSGFRNMLNAILVHDLDPKVVIPRISMKGKSRAYREVIQHFRCMVDATEFCKDYAVSRLNYHLFSSWRDKKNSNLKEKSDFEDFINKFEGTKIIELLKKPIPKSKPKAITERIINRLHSILAEGLLPDDAEVSSGEYRIDNRIVGWDISFPSPDLIPASMKELVIRSNDIIGKILEGKIDMFYAAGKISYDFVSIHPFPDFNGRLSRIIMNMVLMQHGCQFPISIRGSSKEKGRYFKALRRANRGHLDYLTCLIAMRTAQTFEELDRHFLRAGLKSILSFKYKPL